MTDPQRQSDDGRDGRPRSRDEDTGDDLETGDDHESLDDGSDPALPLLSVADVRTEFATERGPLRAVDGVTFDLRPGEALGVVGESGSGKTVLSRSIMGLLPKNARMDGSVRFDGTEIANLAPELLRHMWGGDMSMVFQNPMTSLNPVMKIGPQVAEPLRAHLGMSNAQARKRAAEVMEQVRIPEVGRRLAQYPHELSGGMRQRVMIAMAIACQPRLLFADEPTTALDVTVQAQILELLDDLRREQDMAMILVTHDLGVVAGHTDAIAVMYAGQIVEKAPTRELFANMKMPYTKALLRSIPNIDNAPHTRLLTISGRPPDLISPPPGCRFAPRCAYARERCLEESPPLVGAPERPEHQFACWYPVGSPEYLERDAELVAGVTLTGGQV